MASQPTPPNVLPQKWGVIKGLTIGFPEYGRLLSAYFLLGEVRYGGAPVDY